MRSSVSRVNYLRTRRDVGTISKVRPLALWKVRTFGRLLEKPRFFLVSGSKPRSVQSPRTRQGAVLGRGRGRR